MKQKINLWQNTWILSVSVHMFSVKWVINRSLCDSESLWKVQFLIWVAFCSQLLCGVPTAAVCLVSTFSFNVVQCTSGHRRLLVCGSTSRESVVRGQFFPRWPDLPSTNTSTALFCPRHYCGTGKRRSCPGLQRVRSTVVLVESSSCNLLNWPSWARASEHPTLFAVYWESRTVKQASNWLEREACCRGRRQHSTDRSRRRDGARNGLVQETAQQLCSTGRNQHPCIHHKTPLRLYGRVH